LEIYIDVGSVVWKENEYGIQSAAPISQNLLTKANPKYMSGLIGNKSGNPSHLSNSSCAIDTMWYAVKDRIGLNLSEMVFIDFGCGTGLAILAAMIQPFKKVIGVELDSVSADMCRKNVQTFESNKPELILSRSTEIQTKDICDFEYSKDAAVLLYMYEPLW
jgi:SAM-dependent methyltransferase